MTERQAQAFAVACILVSAFVGWSVGQMVLHVAHVLNGRP